MKNRYQINHLLRSIMSSLLLEYVVFLMNYVVFLLSGGARRAVGPPLAESLDRGHL